MELPYALLTVEMKTAHKKMYDERVVLVLCMQWHGVDRTENQLLNASQEYIFLWVVVMREFDK